MTKRRTGLALHAAVVVLSLCCLVACTCKGGRSSGLVVSSAFYQHWDSLPDRPPQGVIRLAIGGDSRDDRSHVLPWAFEEAGNWGAKAFIFLGDMEITSAGDKLIFAPQLEHLGDIPFYPVMGNHEVKFFGFGQLSESETREKVEKFKKNFLNAPGLNVAPLRDVVVYSVDLGNAVHFIALDNVSRKGGGFGREQLDWLKGDLSAAHAAKKVILVGMHKALANSPVTKHGMEEDKASGIEDSKAALDLFQTYNVAMVFVSHSHMYAAYKQDGIEVRLTGGLGAPLVKGLAEDEGGFHHFLLADVPPGDNRTPLQVEMVKFNKGAPTRDDQDEANEAE